MAARMRSDRRIAQAGAAMRAHGPAREDRGTLPTIQRCGFTRKTRS